MSEPTLAHIKLSQIHPDPEQPRKDFDAEGEHRFLVESIKQHGVVVPIVVRPNGKGYVIVAGERRYTAAKEAKLATIPAMVRETNGDTLIVATVENVVRKDLNPVEEGHAYRRIIEQTENDEDSIAGLVSRPVERVRDRLALTFLDEPTQQKLIDGTLTLNAARVLTDINAVSPNMAAALGWAVGQLFNAHALATDTARCVSAVERYKGEADCPDCEDGRVYANDDDEEGVKCTRCKGEGVIVSKERPPAFLAITPMLQPDDIAAFGKVNAKIGKQLHDAWAEYEKERKAAIQRAGGYAHVEPPRLTEEVFDAARAYGCLVELPTSWGDGTHPIITDAEFAAEYVQAAITEATEQARKEATGKKGKTPAEGSTGGSGQLTAAQKQEKENRAKEREAAKKAKVKARTFNLDLGAALVTPKLAEPKITTEAMKLIVGHLIDQQIERSYSYETGSRKDDSRRAPLLAYLRFTQEQPLDKKGQPIYPRGHEAVQQAVKEAQAMLRAAKTPEQVLGVWVRLVGTAAFADLRGLPKVDAADCGDHDQLDYKAWRSYIEKLLPKAIRDRAPKRKGFSWHD